MEVKFKKLHEDAVLPSYARAGDAGLDITAVSDGEFVASEEGQDLWYYIQYKTGLAVELPQGHVGLLFPRSSISKSSLLLANAVGVVDFGYRQEILFRFKIDTGLVVESEEFKKSPAKYKKGDRIGQLLIIPYPTIESVFVDELSSSDRGGFGSSGA